MKTSDGEEGKFKAICSECNGLCRGPMCPECIQHNEEEMAQKMKDPERCIDCGSRKTKPFQDFYYCQRHLDAAELRDFRMRKALGQILDALEKMKGK